LYFASLRTAQSLLAAVPNMLRSNVVVTISAAPQARMQMIAKEIASNIELAKAAGLKFD